VDVPFWVWALTVAAVVGMLAIDFVGHARTPHAPSLREAAVWSAVYVGVAVVFGLLVFWFAGADRGGEYFAGYLTEKSLSVDNLFVFVLIMGSFAVPREAQQKVLLFGITLALALRTVFIAAGAAAIENFSWVFYVFGAILVYTAWAQARSGGSSAEEEYRENAVLRLVRRVVPTTDEHSGARMLVRVGGKRFITPLAVALLAIGTADVVFAVDSIPAIFGITRDPFLVFTSNIFAVLGLRSLFFLLASVVTKFHLLKYGLAVILTFVGVKMLAENWVHIPILLSLGVVLVVLAASIVASLVWPKAEPAVEGTTGSVFGRERDNG
jgi:TerC family integral membrane protein